MGPHFEVLDGSTIHPNRTAEDEQLAECVTAASSSDRQQYFAQCENSLRYIAARMLRYSLDVGEAVRNCFARTEARRGPDEDEKTFSRRLFRMIIDEALRIQRKRRAPAAGFDPAASAPGAGR